MKSDWSRRLFAGASALCLCFTVAAHAQQPQAYKMRIQAAVPAASIYFDLLKKFGDRIDRMTAGRLKVEVLPDGAVVPAFEILDGVESDEIAHQP